MEGLWLCDKVRTNCTITFKFISLKGIALVICLQCAFSRGARRTFISRQTRTCVIVRVERMSVIRFTLAACSLSILLLVHLMPMFNCVKEDCHLRPIIHLLKHPGCIPKPIPSFACTGKCSSYVQVCLESSFSFLRKSVHAAFGSADKSMQISPRMAAFL